MRKFEHVLRAAERRIGTEALNGRLPEVKSARALKAVPDDRYLSLMCRRVFRAGLKYSMVDNKWPAFEEAFFAFDPRRVHMMSDEELDKRMNDKSLIRHGGKMRSVRENAAAMVQLAQEHGSCGAYLAGWPGDNVVGLWEDIARRFTQMGGRSAPSFLRMAEKDTFMLTDFVVRGLNEWGGIDGPVKSKSDRRRAQDVFNAWAAETGRPLAHLSMILAAAVD